MAGEEKTWWDKLDVVLKPVGGLLTALSVALVGFYGSQYLDRRQAKDTDTRLYADLMSKREEADSALRKAMFDSIINTFLKSGSSSTEQEVMSLELLAYNFHESFDLSPVFKHIYRQIDPKTKEGQDYLKRLKKVASEVTSKQIAALEESGANAKLDGTIVFDDIDKNLEQGTPVMEGVLTMHPKDSWDLPEALRKRYFRVDALYVDRERQEVRLKLKVKTPGANGTAAPQDQDDVDMTFWVGFFDFPLIDNTRLAHGQRCAITVKDFNPSRAQITLTYFPGSRASLKEKPYYEEIVNSLRREQAQ